MHQEETVEFFFCCFTLSCHALFLKMDPERSRRLALRLKRLEDKAEELIR